MRKLSFRSLSTALVCLLTAYKEDFYDPPHYATLNHLLQQTIDTDVKYQCQSLLNRFLNEENNQKLSTTNLFQIVFHFPYRNLSFIPLDTYGLKPDINNNNNNSKALLTDDIYHEKDFDYNTERSLLEMSHVMIAEQLTIIDAVSFYKKIIINLTF